MASQMAEDLYVMSVDSTWAMHDNTSDENPISVGIAHNDLSVTEISEALLAEMTDPSDIIARERSRRPVRRVGTFSGPELNQVLNDGKNIRTKVKFVIGDGHQLAVYAVNRSNATLTTGTQIELEGVIYGRWLR